MGGKGYVPEACGFIPYRPAAAGFEYLLLTSRKWGEAGFPKGHAEPGETELETAGRETREEVGREALPHPGGFRREIRYPVQRKGRRYEKRAVYFLARLEPGDIRLSREHTEAGWYPLAEARDRLAHGNLRGVLRDAALYLKDVGLFELEPRTEVEADAWLCALPEAHATLRGHLRGAARLARRMAAALLEADRPVHVEATAVGTLLHDTGRALGRHDDHQAAGLAHLRDSPFAAYGFACVSHFTKGASRAELAAAGLPEPTLRAFEALVDTTTLTWEERCAALADACMSRDRAVRPVERFAELRRRYGDVPLIALQERCTERIRREVAEAAGTDPIALLD